MRALEQLSKRGSRDPTWPFLSRVLVLLVTFALHLRELHIQEPWSDAAPLGLFLQSGVFAGTLVLLLARGGLLTATVFYAVTIALWETPITYDLTRWYAWRTGVVVMLVGALAFWGFRNVLGRQSAFPAGALDD